MPQPCQSLCADLRLCPALSPQVALTAILWGCGTAVGEVPPYFLSYKAASAGRRNEAYHEIQQAVQQGTSGTLRVRSQALITDTQAAAHLAVAGAWRMGPCAQGSWLATD
jgi:hypothetical protein